MRDTILKDLMEAMKNQDNVTLSVLRMVKGAMQLEEINVKRNLNDDEVIGLLSKQIKTRKESITEFEKAGRSELVQQTNKEIEILNRYMPEQLSEEEVLKLIDEVFEEVKPTSRKDMGKIMGIINPKINGKADKSFVSKTIQEKLANL